VKLGIAVVYLVSPGTEPLLDIHLDWIDRYTKVPYRIYGSVNRLASPLVERLERRPQVVLCDVPTTEERGAIEHSHYLDHLIKAAIDDGATHLLTLHVDSFPVAPTWTDRLFPLLTETCAFVTIDRINTAFFLFHRDFYLAYRPTFRLTPVERASAEFGRYMGKYHPIPHSGIGYGFRAFSEGMTWHYLTEPQVDTHSADFPSIYEGLIFHLKGTVRIAPGTPEPLRGPGGRRSARLTERFLAVAKRMLPANTRMALRLRFRDQFERFIEAPLRNQALRRLITNPEGYIKALKARRR
jgi:hypothetical protein